MSDARDWRDFLSCITYKPGWQFHLFGFPAALRIVALVKDRDTLEPIEIQNNYPVPPFYFDSEHQIRFVRDCIRRLELHESDEWLKVNGVRVFEPHNPQE